jgi:hypothetical protein
MAAKTRFGYSQAKVKGSKTLCLATFSMAINARALNSCSMSKPTSTTDAAAPAPAA